MGKTISVSLGNYYNDFVNGSISRGRYSDPSEVIRAALRLLEEEENQLIALKNAIEEGLQSGIDENFDPMLHLQQLKSNRADTNV